MSPTRMDFIQSFQNKATDMMIHTPGNVFQMESISEYHRFGIQYSNTLILDAFMHSMIENICTLVRIVLFGEIIVYSDLPN